MKGSGLLSAMLVDKYPNVRIGDIIRGGMSDNEIKDISECLMDNKKLFLAEAVIEKIDNKVMRENCLYALACRYKKESMPKDAVDCLSKITSLSEFDLFGWAKEIIGMHLEKIDDPVELSREHNKEVVDEAKESADFIDAHEDVFFPPECKSGRKG